MSVGDIDASDTDRSAPGLRWLRDREPARSRVTVFDPRPARLDEAWIEIDADGVVALRAMR